MGVTKVGIYQEGALPLASLVGPPSNWTGFEIDILKQICGTDLDDCTFERVLTLDERLDIVRNGTADLSIGSIVVNQERSELVDFVHPYYYSSGEVLYATAESASAIVESGGWSGVSGKPICTETGNYANDLLKNKYEAELVFVETVEDGLSKAENGDCIGFMWDSGQLLSLPSVLGLETLQPSPYGIAVRMDGNASLYNFLAASSVRLMQDGSESKILLSEKQWFDGNGLSSNPDLENAVQSISSFVMGSESERLTDTSTAHHFAIPFLLFILCICLGSAPLLISADTS